GRAAWIRRRPLRPHGAGNPSAAGQASAGAARQCALVLGLGILQVAHLAVESGLGIGCGRVLRRLVAGLVGRVLPVRLPVTRLAGPGAFLLSGTPDTSGGRVIGRCRQGGAADQWRPGWPSIASGHAPAMSTATGRPASWSSIAFAATVPKTVRRATSAMPSRLAA